jgi:hypothetical protein
MARVVRFLRLTPQQRWLLCKATALLAVVRVSLSVLPYPVVRALLDRIGRSSSRLERNPPPAEQLAWATTVSGRIVPGGGHCLSQALTLCTFLGRRSYPARICYGVREVEGAPLMAHAWVEHDGAVLIGGGNLERFRRLLAPYDQTRAATLVAGGQPDVE